MDDFARTIFESAVIKERAAHEMYVDMAENARIKDVQSILTTLAEEELVHARLFSKMDLDILKKVNKMELNKIKLRFEVESLSKDHLKEINEMLEYAIGEEKRAYEDYMLLVKHLPDGEGRETVKEIAVQEAKHRTILQKLKLEYNKNDWSQL